MNAKKIAEKLREIASFYGPDDGCTNAIYDALIAIANELDPPAKPLLADARVGDLCQRRDGKWVQIDSVSHDRPCPVMCKSDIGGQDCFTLDGRNHNGWPSRRAVNNDKDIIATEPLAEVGTAEWAWQMAKLGIETRCYEGKIKVSKSGLIEVCYNGTAYAMPLTQSPDNKAYTIKKISQCSPTGWQLYEEPEFNVGDFVKYDIDTYLRVIEPSGKDKTLCKTLSGVIVYPYTSCLTKASPSEVIVKIGCLEGTVTYAISDDCFLLAKVYDPQHRACCIDMSMLDTPTRELVESLLRAQEVNNG